MKEKALKYLMKNQMIHIGMIEPINRGTVDIIYAGSDGVLIKELKSNAYMISVDTVDKGRELLENVSECNLAVVHQQFMVDDISDRYGLKDKLECVQAVYMHKDKLTIVNNIKIRQMDMKHAATILEHYHMLSETEIRTLLKEGNIYGGYQNETLIGFVGMHLEGSIGLLEVFPEYRQHGYGTMLESYMVNKILDTGAIPYAQVEIKNEKSMALQKKLGFSLTKDSICWIF